MANLKIGGGGIQVLMVYYIIPKVNVLRRMYEKDGYQMWLILLDW